LKFKAVSVFSSVKSLKLTGSGFDDSSLFPTTSMPSPTLGNDEQESKHVGHSQHLSLYLGFDHVVGSVVVDGSGLNNDAKLTTGNVKCLSPTYSFQPYPLLF
jgi:hypothetical protein